MSDLFGNHIVCFLTRRLNIIKKSIVLEILFTDFRFSEVTEHQENMSMKSIPP